MNRGIIKNVEVKVLELPLKNSGKYLCMSRQQEPMPSSGLQRRMELLGLARLLRLRHLWEKRDIRWRSPSTGI